MRSEWPISTPPLSRRNKPSGIYRRPLCRLCLSRLGIFSGTPSLVPKCVRSSFGLDYCHILSWCITSDLMARQLAAIATADHHPLTQCLCASNSLAQTTQVMFFSVSGLNLSGFPNLRLAEHHSPTPLRSGTLR